MGIETMLRQTCSDFEFIIVVDHCDDLTRRRIRQYARDDRRIRVIEHVGPFCLASALNAGIAACSGHWIARVDGNIEYCPDRLERQLRFLSEHSDIDILGSNFWWATEGKDRKRQIILPESHDQVVRRLSVQNSICHPSVIFNRKRILSLGRAPYRWWGPFRKAQDYDLWMRARKSLRFANLQQPLLTKWHRAAPWRELSRFEYIGCDYLARLAGLTTSPNPFVDVVNLWRPLIRLLT